MQEDVYQRDGLNLYAYCGNNPVGYYDPSGYERKACPLQGKISESVDEGGSKTGTVWDNITPTQENYPVTNIPKSFEIEGNGEKMWVYGNATEHMYEDVYKRITTGNGTANTNANLYIQEIMSDFMVRFRKQLNQGLFMEKRLLKVIGNLYLLCQDKQDSCQ